MSLRSAAYPMRSQTRELFELYGQWTGNGTSQPVTVKRTDNALAPAFKGLALTRTGVGLYTLSVTDGGVPYFASIGGRIVSTTNSYTVRVLSFSQSAGTAALRFDIAGTATDPTTAETIMLSIAVANAGQP